jgi:hypothetical protein
VPYNDWDWCIEPKEYFSHHQLESIFPTGVGGILYPPGCFYKDILNKDLFTKLAPFADDIWFWAMAIINKDVFGDESPYAVVSNGHSRNVQIIDPEHEWGGGALLTVNTQQGGNDKQLKAIIEYYPQIKDVLKKIKPV